MSADELSHDEIRARFRIVCERMGIPADRLDMAAAIAHEVYDVESLATGSTNKAAMSRLLGVFDDAAMEDAENLAVVNARDRLEQRRAKAGRVNPRVTRRDGEALAEGVVAGVELAIALQRMVKRGDLG